MGLHVALITAGGEGITPKLERPAQRISPRDSLSPAWPRPEFHVVNLGVFCASWWARWAVGKHDCSANGEKRLVAGIPERLLTSRFSVPQFPYLQIGVMQCRGEG